MKPTQVAIKEKNAAEDRMAKVQAKLDEMQAQFDAAMAQKQVGDGCYQGVQRVELNAAVAAAGDS